MNSQAYEFMSGSLEEHGKFVETKLKPRTVGLSINIQIFMRI